MNEDVRLFLKMLVISFQVGHVREVKMEDGSIKKMVTMALKPKIFGKHFTLFVF